MRRAKTDPTLLDLRVRSLWSPFIFTTAVLGCRDLTTGLHLAESENFIERWLAGDTKQFVEWPRGFFKTTTFTQGIGMWLVCPVSQEDTDYALGTLGMDEAAWHRRMSLHNQNLLQLVAMETDKNAIKKVGWIKGHFESNTLFRAIFPEIAYAGKEEPWNASCIKIRRTGGRQYEHEGTFEAIGVGVALQSRHYDLVWEDDLVGEKAIKSTSEMEDTIGWHRRLAGAFVNAGRQVRFGVSNRWGYNDLNSYIRRHEPDFVFHTRRAWELAADGTNVPAFPERYPMDRLLKIKGGMTEVDFNCQYLNNPMVPGDASVSTAKLHTYTVEEDGRMVCSCGRHFYLSSLQRYMHLDPSQARARSTSRPCIAVVGTAPDKHVFLLDFWMKKADYGAIFKTLTSFNNAYRPKMLTYEDVGSQNMFEYHLRQLQESVEFKEAKNRRFPYIQPVPTKSEPKEDRIKQHFFPVVEAGRFAYRPFTQQALPRQMETFPFPALDHDYDLLDVLAQGALVWRYQAAEAEARDAANAEANIEAALGKPYSVLATP